MRPTRTIRRLGDTAFHVGTSTMAEAHGLAWAIGQAGWSGVEEIVVGNRTVTVVADPDLGELEDLADRSANLAPSGQAELSPRTIEIPIAFDGPDLEEVALSVGMSASEVSAAVVGAELVVAMVGFVPGFGYLDGLPEALASVPRRPTPRARVPAGAVALGGGYAGVYPVETPGGWQLVGHTTLQLFDREVPPFALLRPADQVRFREVDRIESRAAPDRRRRMTVDAGVPSVRVVSPGTLTTIQDLGRIGAASLGVPRAGPADAFSARLANRAVTNPDAAALLEMTLLGATLQFDAPRFVALVGDAVLTIDGRATASRAVHPVAAGQVVEIGAIGPAPRAFLAIGGGIENPLVLGSRSSDLLCGIGPGPLVAGDVLPLGAADRARGGFGLPARSTTLRVLRGPDALDDEAWGSVVSAGYVVGPRSDRTGIRLEPDVPLSHVGGVPGSVAMVTGAVQLPPDGQPIILGVDHSTLGGYPVVAVVASADLARVGQLLPGDQVHLEAVDGADAGRLRRESEASLEGSLKGWYPVEAG